MRAGVFILSFCLISFANGPLLAGHKFVNTSGSHLHICDTNQLHKSKSLDNGIELNISQVKFKNSGYQVQFTAGLLAGKTRIGDEYNMSFQISSGYQFLNRWSIGLGCGAEYLAVPIIPFFYEMSYTILDKPISPYLYIKAGYGFAFVERSDQQYYYEDYNSNPYNSQGGFLLNVGMGITSFSWERTAVVVGVGYRYQRVTERLRMWSGMYQEVESNFNRIEVKFGFLFR